MTTSEQASQDGGVGRRVVDTTGTWRVVETTGTWRVVEVTGMRCVGGFELIVYAPWKVTSLCGVLDRK